MNPISVYTTVEKYSPALCFGQFPANTVTAESFALWKSATYRGHSRGRSPEVYSDIVNQGSALGSYRIQNRSGGAANFSLVTRVPTSQWKAGQIDENDAYTDDTTDAQDTDDGTPDFAAESATNDAGFVIASKVPFNVVSARIGTASADAGNAQTRTLLYSNSLGTGWSTLPIANAYVNTLWPATGNTTATTTLATEALLAFTAPTDWGRVTSLGTVPSGYYAMKFNVSDQPGTTLMVLDELAVGLGYFIQEGLADNGIQTLQFGSKDFIIGEGPDGQMYGEHLWILQSTIEMNPVQVQMRNR